MVNVAILGDSYISGEGLRPDQGGGYEPGTDYVNQCHRAHSSWAYQLAEDLQAATDVEPSRLLFAACSGAKTSDVLHVGQYPGGPDVPGRRPQVEDLALGDPAAPVDVVLLSIGGNDARFADRVSDCVVSWDRCRPQMASDEIEVVEGAIHATIHRIRQIVGPQARIVLSNYVDPIRPQRTCSPELLRVSAVELADLSVFLHQVNIAVDEGARRGGADVIDLSNAFEDRGLCTDSNYMNGIRTGTNAHLGKFNKPSGDLKPAARESFHPTQDGHIRLLSVARPSSNRS